MDKRERRFNILWGVGVFCFIAFFIIKAIKDKTELKENQDYTVGLAIDTYKGVKAPIPSVSYVYTINGVKYDGAHGYDPKIYKVEKGKKYLVIYSPRNPANSRMLLKIMLSDSVVAPFEGWRAAPFGVTDTLDSEW